MPNRYDVDSPEIYDYNEINSIIENYGIEYAVDNLDLSKINDRKLGEWLKQFKDLRDKIHDYVLPRVISIKPRVGYAVDFLED